MNNKHDAPPRTKYQIHPPLPHNRHEAMKTSVDRIGVDQPTTWDDEGNLLDGWERETACAELGVTCPREVRHFETEAAKFQFILDVNSHRRPSLTRKQKRQVIEAYLRGDPGVADNTLAEALAVSKNTVRAVRRRLEAGGEIPRQTKTRGKDGKLRPVRYTKRIITNTPGEFRKAKDIIKALPDSCAGPILDVTAARRRVARCRNRVDRAGRDVIVPLPSDAIRLYHCRFQELEVNAGITPATVNLVLTDIPYGQDFVPQVAALGELAQRVLVEDGLLLCMCGQFWLHKVIEALNQSLKYRWPIASVWDGPGNPVYIGGWKHPHGRVVSRWKPILVYSKDEYKRGGQWCDVYRDSGKEKDWHAWQQSLELFEKLVREFSSPGDLVVDPCGGGFTTAEACLRLGRRFVGCDLEADCVGTGQERLKRARDSLTLGA
jgi:hypothetical protein